MRRLHEGVQERECNGGQDWVSIAPGNPEAVRGAIRRAARKNIPVVCVTTDAPGTERLTVILADPAASGAIAAELLGRVLWGKGTVAVFTGSLQTSTHAESFRGFGAILATMYQRPRNQGWQALRVLHRFLLEGVCPPAQTRFPPHIVLRSNVHLFAKPKSQDSFSARSGDALVLRE